MSKLIMSMSFLILCYTFFMFGQKIKELRLEKKISQIKLSKILECHQSMITRWEKGECEPTETIIRRAALYFNVSADYLLGLEDDTGAKYVNSFNNARIDAHDHGTIKF